MVSEYGQGVHEGHKHTGLHFKHEVALRTMRMKRRNELEA